MELHENYSAVMKGFIKFAKDDVEAEKWIATDKICIVAGWENSERVNFRRDAFEKIRTITMRICHISL